MSNIIAKLTVSEPTDMWFGDPCYVYPKSTWGEFCKHFEGTKGSQAIGFEENGHHFMAMDTAHGDGDYGLSVYNRFQGVVFVDSGTLAFIPIDLIREWGGDLRCGIVIHGFQGTVIADPENCSWSGAIDCETDAAVEDDDHDTFDDWGDLDGDDEDWAEAA